MLENSRIFGKSQIYWLQTRIGDYTLSEKHEHTESASEGGRLNLRADCERCFALCCVVPTFSASADFPITKKAGQACPNLQPDFRCVIHACLRQQGFRGCAVYDCFGAGQKVSQATFGGQDWLLAPRTAKQMFEVFLIMRDLHELLWYLTEALTLPSAHSLHDELSLALTQIERLTHNSPDALMQLDVKAHRREINDLLLRASELVRARFQHKKDYRGADLIGAKLKGADLRGANLRGAYLIGADLSRADLRMADLTGADFRDADLRGADLTGSIFLIQSQLDAAKGDIETKLPSSLTRPKHW
ncbi:MAG: pentapeptide repeat-containing protein [Chloroflexi bacterium]|nr:pentapeptide repeat-containing protein [Chloroflexota bacterium]